MADNGKGSNWSFLQLAVLAVVLDIVFKQFPFLSAIQAVLPVAVLAGFLYGPEKGILVGIIASFVSGTLLFSADFFSASLFFVQFLASAIAGALGGFASRKKTASTSEFVSLCVVAAIAFEALNNFLNGTSFNRVSGYYFLEGTALAGALHIIFAIVLAILLSRLLESNKE